MSIELSLAKTPSAAVIHRSWCNDNWRHTALSSVVAVPACNEASRIDRCLWGLGSQTTNGAFGVLVLVNGTSDTTFPRAVAHGRRHPLPLCVIEAQLPFERRDAGAARCAAIGMAMANMVTPDGTIFSTDADSVAPAGWLHAYRTLLSTGWDLVAGTVAISPDDDNDIPRSLRYRDQWERHYEALLDALEHRLDPVEHDPWPRHYSANGANLAFRCSSLKRLRDIPWPATSEDKHVVAHAEALGLRVRHDTTCKVITSGRIFGRARGGKADTMRRRILEPDSPCDDRLETVDIARFRAQVRRECRDIHGRGVAGTEDVAEIAARLGLGADAVAKAMRASCFEAAWADIEPTIPQLRRKPIRPGQLAHQSTLAEALLVQLGTLPGGELAIEANNP